MYLNTGTVSFILSNVCYLWYSLFLKQSQVVKVIIERKQEHPKAKHRDM